MEHCRFRKAGLTTSSIITLIYILIVTVIGIGNNFVLLLLIAAPFLFFILYTFTYQLVAGTLKFLTPSRMMRAYDNPVDNYMRSGFSKAVGSIVLSVICFLPILIFYILFSWIFYLGKKQRHFREIAKLKENNGDSKIN